MSATPAPLELLCSSTPSQNGAFHLYVADASGRKIAALWGGNEEKLANGYLFSAAPSLLTALKLARGNLDHALNCPARYGSACECSKREIIAAIDAALDAAVPSQLVMAA